MTTAGVWILEYYDSLGDHQPWRSSRWTSSGSFAQFLYLFLDPLEPRMMGSIEYYRIRNTQTGEIITASQLLALACP